MNPLNANLDIVDWLNYLWLNKLWWKKNFDNVLGKVLLFWTHRKNVVFKGDKCNLAYVLELARKWFVKPLLIEILLMFILTQIMQVQTAGMQVKDLIIRIGFLLHSIG